MKDGKALRPPAVRNTLSVLHVKEFVYRPNKEFTERAAVIDILLGTIPITGRLPQGALERAYLTSTIAILGNCASTLGILPLSI